MEKVLYTSTYGARANHERTVGIDHGHRPVRCCVLDDHSGPIASGLGYGHRIEILQPRIMSGSNRSASRVTRSLRIRSSISPQPKTLVRSKETSTEQLLALPSSPQLANKRCSQRDKVFPHAASMSRSWVRCQRWDTLTDSLLASELTDCLAQEFLNRARCLALIVSGENVSLSALPRMWRPELASVREPGR